MPTPLELARAANKRKPRQPKGHTVRTRDGGTKHIHPYTRSLAVKVYCCECLGWEESPQACTNLLCPLYPFRGGTSVTQRGTKTDR